MRFLTIIFCIHKCLINIIEKCLSNICHSDDLDRKLQARELARIMDERFDAFVPTFSCGAFFFLFKKLSQICFLAAV